METNEQSFGYLVAALLSGNPRPESLFFLDFADFLVWRSSYEADIISVQIQRIPVYSSISNG